MATDPLDELFELEDTFYKEGYNLGVQDGSRAGQIEGRLFGLEKAFEKYTAMGKLHGRSVVWSGRLSSAPEAELPSPTQSSDGQDPETRKTAPDPLPPLPFNPRLEKHVRTLYALTEPASLSTENSEDAVSDFDDRLRRAEGKVKIIERFIGEETTAITTASGIVDGTSRGGQHGIVKRDGGIEDASVLQARH
ncbi:MAG: hypothetical protein LQ344_001730 [Seirophora lacunosa]|nr:MAG: hypothetical protein LQ344_001730 [Seirophora lacunosa]